MGKIRNFDIIFNKTPIFAGQNLTGNLSFSVKETVTVKNILLSFEGSSKICDKIESKETQEKWYFRIEIPLTGYLIQYGNFKGKHKIPPGEHSIPFRFPIPPYAPNSFGGKHGYIYYCAKGCIYVGGGPEIRIEKAIPVVGIEDLNWHPQGATPLFFHEGYNQKIFCFNLSDVSAVLQLARSAYVPGETIKITAEIANRSKKKKVKRTAFQIIQTVYYNSGGGIGKAKETHEVVAQVNFGEILPEGVRKLEEEALEVPALPPSFLRGCDGINIRYDFLFVVDPGIRIQVPILIGTIPYTLENLKMFSKCALPWNGTIKLPKGDENTTNRKNRGKLPQTGQVPRQKFAQNCGRPTQNTPCYATKDGLPNLPHGKLVFGQKQVPITVDPRLIGQHFGQIPGNFGPIPNRSSNFGPVPNENSNFGPVPTRFVSFVMTNGNFCMQKPAGKGYRKNNQGGPVIYSPPSDIDAESLRTPPFNENGTGNIYENDSQMYGGVLKIEEID